MTSGPDGTQSEGLGSHITCSEPSQLHKHDMMSLLPPLFLHSVYQNLKIYLAVWLCVFILKQRVSPRADALWTETVFYASYSLFVPSTWLTWDSIHANEREQANPLISEVPKAKCFTLSLLETPPVNGDLYTSSIKQCCFPQHFIHDTCTVLSTPAASMTFKSPFNLLG